MSTLVVIDMQAIFAEPESAWASPGTFEIVPNVEKLVAAFAGHTVFTRFVAPAEPEGAWREYYEQWSFALVPDAHPLYALLPGVGYTGQPVVTLPTFGKWGPELAALVDDEIILSGVSSDCCVITTALAAADAGIKVRVLRDASAGVSPADHERAMAAMAMFTPLIEITDTATVLAERASA